MHLAYHSSEIRDSCLIKIPLAKRFSKILNTKNFFPFFISYTNSIFSKIWQIWSILFGAFHQAKKPVISEEWYEYLYYNYLKRSQHGRSKYFCIILTGKIESVDLFIIPPLMKCRCGLVIFETLQNGTIDHDLENNKQNDKD